MALKTKTDYPYVNKDGTKKKFKNPKRPQDGYETLGTNYIQREETSTYPKGKKVTKKVGDPELYSISRRGKSVYHQGKTKEDQAKLQEPKRVKRKNKQ